MPHDKKHKIKVTPDSGERRLKPRTYRRFRLEKRIKHPGKPLPSAPSIFKISLRHLWKYKTLFAWITLVYLLLTLLFVRGYIFTNDLTVAKEAIQELVSGASGQLASSLTVLGILVGTSTSNGQTSVLYQAIITIIISLAAIWSLRQSHAQKTVNVKDAFYKSTYPLIPFMIILLVVGVQMLPMAAGNFLYSAAVNAGLTSTFIEHFAWLGLIFILTVWSLYMITVTLFALYIVTLPDMTPLRAIRAAKELVRFRRWTILRKLIFLPFVLILLGTVLLLPVIMLLTPVAEVVFLVLSALSLVVVHSYMYTLYREML